MTNPESIQLATLGINQVPLDWQGNWQRIQEALKHLYDAATPTADIILLPELVLSGYSCEDAFLRPDTQARAWEMSQKLALFSSELSMDSLIFAGLPFFWKGHLYNCMAAIYRGQVIGLNPKMHLANDGLHYEARQFRAWHSLQSEQIELEGHPIRIGPLLYDYKGMRIAIEICRDSWYPDRPALLHAPSGIDLVLNPSASHFAMGKYDMRRQLALESSRALACHFVQINLLGNEAGRVIFDGASLFSSNGHLLYSNRGLGFGDFSWSQQELHIAGLRAAQRRAAPARHFPLIKISPDSDKPNWDVNTISVESIQSRITGFQANPDHSNQARQTDLQRPGSGCNPARPQFDHDNKHYLEFLWAACLGLFDYLRKSHTRGFALSLSGGADSAACALLVHRMIAIGLSELGVTAFCKRLNRDDLYAAIQNQSANFKDLDLEAPVPVESLAKLSRFACRHLLITVYQATRQSSQTTRKAAEAIATAIGSHHSSIQIDDVVDSYQDLAAQAMGRDLNWDDDNLTMQNIQARSRSPLVWMLANSNNYLLIATGNRSEVSTGYCTMDGDTSGSLAPLGGVSKRFILDFLRFMEHTGDPLLGPLAELHHITTQQPTAELRPLADKQTDEAELMPYPILELIERWSIIDQMPANEIVSRLKQSPLGQPFTDVELEAMVDRFMKLWQRSQWKRERLAPAFHLDDYSLDPRGWHRFPILSGPSKQEQ